MNPIARALLAFALFASSKAGAAGAGATGSLLTAGVVVGQIEVPEGVPTWLAALLVGVGPAVAWLFTRVIASAGAFYATKAARAQQRAAELEERNEPNSGPVIARFKQEADDAAAISAALDTFKALPPSKGAA